MAISKQAKQELVHGYVDLLSRSQGVILAEYHALPMPVLNGLRTAVRNSGGGLHAAKNTLAVLALREAGMAVPEGLLAGPTIIGFAHGDMPALAKAMLAFQRDNADRFSIKGGVMGRQVLAAQDVEALATLPPLPVLRAQLIGMLQTPAARIAQVLAAPGAQVARVLRAYADKQQETPGAEPAAA